MGVSSTVRRTLGRAGGRARRLIPLAAALLMAALVSIPASNIALAQAPPSGGIVLVNADRDFVERKKKGEFVARPVFDRKIVNLFYAVRDADTGDWISAMYRVKGGEKKRSDGWEYSWEYPDLDEQPDLDPDRSYLLVMLAEAEDGRRGDFYAVVPIHQSGKIWDKILVRPQPRTLGQSPRRLGHRGRPRDPLRSCRAGVRRGRRQLPGRVAGHVRHHHRHPSRPDLRPLAGAAGVDGRLGRHLRRPGGHPGLDGPLVHHVRAPGQRPRPGWREMVPRLVLGLVAAASSLWWCALVIDVADAVSGFIAFSLERHPRRHAALHPEAP